MSGCAAGKAAAHRPRPAAAAAAAVLTPYPLPLQNERHGAAVPPPRPLPRRVRLTAKQAATIARAKTEAAFGKQPEAPAKKGPEPSARGAPVASRKRKLARSKKPAAPPPARPKKRPKARTKKPKPPPQPQPLRQYDGAKKIKCPECNYRCDRVGHMRIHMRTHSGEMPFPCLFCWYRSSDKSNLKKHVIRRHPEELRGMPPPKDRTYNRWDPLDEVESEKRCQEIAESDNRLADLYCKSLKLTKKRGKKPVSRKPLAASKKKKKKKQVPKKATKTAAANHCPPLAPAAVSANMNGEPPLLLLEDDALVYDFLQEAGW